MACTFHSLQGTTGKSDYFPFNISDKKKIQINLNKREKIFLYICSDLIIRFAKSIQMICIFYLRFIKNKTKKRGGGLFERCCVFVFLCAAILLEEWQKRGKL